MVFVTFASRSRHHSALLVPTDSGRNVRRRRTLPILSRWQKQCVWNARLKCKQEELNLRHGSSSCRWCGVRTRGRGAGAGGAAQQRDR